MPEIMNFRSYGKLRNTGIKELREFEGLRLQFQNYEFPGTTCFRNYRNSYEFQELNEFSGITVLRVTEPGNKETIGITDSGIRKISGITELRELGITEPRKTYDF